MSDPHQPLRDDVRLLGNLLGDVIQSQEGQELFETVEQVRARAKTLRASPDADLSALGAFAWYSVGLAVGFFLFYVLGILIGTPTAKQQGKSAALLL